MTKNLPINYGDKILLKTCKVETPEVLQGEQLRFSAKWKLLERVPIGTKVCYYFTDGISKTITFLDTEKSSSQNVFYSQMGIGNSFEDKIEIKVPYNLSPGNYEINAFVFPNEGFKPSNGISSKVWPEQKVIGGCCVKWQKDLSKKFVQYDNSSRKNFFNGLIDYWRRNPAFIENENMYMWADFAFTTNMRGNMVINLLKKYVEIKNKNFLDVGCAYCGFLIAAKLNGAKLVEGIDINNDLLELGKQNLKDYEVDGFVHMGDILDSNFAIERKETFDVITCNDVIEHVLDPELTIKNISTMLKKNGHVMFEIPNKNNPKFVIKDGHYSAFAITLFDREEAIKYYKESYGGDYSSVAYHYLLSEYKKIFQKNKLKFIIDDKTMEYVSKVEICNDIEYIRKNFNNLLSRVDSNNKNIVKTKVMNYLREFDSNYKKMSDKDFLLFYGPSFWTIMGKKN